MMEGTMIRPTENPSPRGPRPAPAAGLIRKEQPTPGPKPPARPPAPGGIQAPSNSGTSGGMICPGPGISRLRPSMSSRSEMVEETSIETPVQKVLKKPSALGGKSIHLVVIEGEDKGLAFDLTGIGTYTIGRKECDIVLRDDKISRKHASVVIARADQFAVNDLASKNGTFVNGVRLSRRNLQHNDLIRVGNTTLRFTVFDGPVPVQG
jgi:hypothetical protein